MNYSVKLKLTRSTFASWEEGHKKGQCGRWQQPGGGQRTEEQGNEGMGEGRQTTVDVVVMPTIIAIATSRHCATRAAMTMMTTTTMTMKMTMTMTTTTRTTTTTMTEGGRRGQDGNGGLGGQPGVIHSSGQSPSSCQGACNAPMNQASQGADNCTHFGLSPFNYLLLNCKLKEGHKKQPVLVALSS